MADGEENKYHAMSVASFEVFVEQKGMVITFHSSPNLQEFKTIWIQVLSPCAIQVTMWPQRRFIQWRSWSLTITKSTFQHHWPDCINPLQVLDLPSQCPIPIEHPSKPLWHSTIPISSWRDPEQMTSKTGHHSPGRSPHLSLVKSPPKVVSHCQDTWLKLACSAAWQQRSSVKIVVCWGQNAGEILKSTKGCHPPQRSMAMTNCMKDMRPVPWVSPTTLYPSGIVMKIYIDHFVRHKKVVHLHQNCSARSRKTIYASGGWVGKHLGQDILHPCDISKQPPQSKFEPVSRKVAWNDSKS